MTQSGYVAGRCLTVTGNAIVAMDLVKSVILLREENWLIWRRCAQFNRPLSTYQRSSLSAANIIDDSISRQRVIAIPAELLNTA